MGGEATGVDADAAGGERGAAFADDGMLLQRPRVGAEDQAGVADESGVGSLAECLEEMKIVAFGFRVHHFCPTGEIP